MADKDDVARLIEQNAEFDRQNPDKAKTAKDMSEQITKITESTVKFIFMAYNTDREFAIELTAMILSGICLTPTKNRDEALALWKDIQARTQTHFENIDKSLS